MNAKQFGEKYGTQYMAKIPQWYAAGYLGKAAKNEKTGIYSIPDDIPLPYQARGNVTRIPTLWKDMLAAAAGMRSLFASMYPKLPEGVFDRQLRELCEAGFIRVSETASGDPYLELQPAGLAFMNQLDDAEKRTVLDKVKKAVDAGYTFLKALSLVAPYLK